VIDENWTPYLAGMISGHHTQRLVVFKAGAGSKFIGCLRVLEAQDIKNMIWDKVRCEGIWMGLVPENCPFEAMLVDIKLITTS